MRISYLFHGNCYSHLKKQVLRILSNQRSIFKTKQKFRYHIFECLGIQVHVYKDGVVNLHHIFLYVYFIRDNLMKTAKNIFVLTILSFRF